MRISLSLQLLFLAVLGICCSAQAPPAYPGTRVDQELVRAVHEEVNKYRQSLGLRALKMESPLNQIALKHSEDMAQGRIPFSHEGFEDRMKAIKKYAKGPYRMAENLYASNIYAHLARMCVKGWIESPGHHKNLKGDWLYTGIGISKNARGEYYVTQLYLGKP